MQKKPKIIEKSKKKSFVFNGYRMRHTNAWCGLVWLGVAHRLGVGFGKKTGYQKGIKVFLFFGVAGISWPDQERFVFNTI